MTYLARMQRLEYAGSEQTQAFRLAQGMHGKASMKITKALDLTSKNAWTVFKLIALATANARPAPIIVNYKEVK